jgi:hypothetical protein
MGDGQTGVLSAFDGTTSNNVFKFRNITSQDLTLGMRWHFDSVSPPPPPPPIVRKG